MASRIALLLVLLAAPLLLANWFVVDLVLGHGCASPYEGGNLTECVGGLSEEETTAVSGLVAVVLLAVECRLIVVLAVQFSRKKARPPREG
ncbi:hypothetical protein Nocox_24305 [Nonomuraea coxensis DSM 45129]|uniref:Uncharacterized protein n=1 Tax=Nonomuraea coxensis DSM 45129 TaxID=1122611 RepID=A0ABX8U6U1_9ACTN|nr:hypothetical protein [Nonomuraea coxensis]QYC42464.1 hypothetical protein Nocox_24305 [Nonomuraea coxensis DSM 45129]